MNTVRESIGEIYDQLLKRGYRFRNPKAAFCPATSDAETVVEEIESRFGDLPLSLRYFWIDVGSVDFCQEDAQLIQWHRNKRASAADLEILGEEDPLYVETSTSVLRELIDAEGHESKYAPGALYGGREPHMDRWYCHLACDEFHKANYSGGENYSFFLPDSAADFRIYDLWEMGNEREWFVDHLSRCIEGGGFRGRIQNIEGEYSKPLPRNSVSMAIGRLIKTKWSNKPAQTDGDKPLI